MTEFMESECAAQRESLLRQAYADAADMPPALRTHLAACDTCRAAFEAAQRMNVALRTALAPEALSEHALDLFQQRLATEPARRRLTRHHLYRLVGTAAAAGLAAALILPWWWHGSAPQRTPAGGPSAVALSSEDAATILAAYTCVGWEGTTGTALDLLADQVKGVSRAVRREAGAATLLPWNRENDWDLPTDDAGALRVPAAKGDMAAGPASCGRCLS